MRRCGAFTWGWRFDAADRDSRAASLLRRCPSSLRHRLRSRCRRGRRDHRRQRRGQEHVPQIADRSRQGATRCDPLRRRADRRAAAGRHRAARHRTGARGAAALSEPDGPREPADGCERKATRTMEPAAAVRDVPDPRTEAPRARHRTVGRPAADGRDRPRADEQPCGAAVRRAVAGARADRHPRDLRRVAEDRCRRHDRRHRRAGRRHCAAGVAAHLLLPGGPRLSARQVERSDPRTDQRRVFWILTTMTETLIQGLLLGGLYCLFALGQSLMFGVMRLTNTAQGDFIVLGAFGAIALASLVELHPALIALVLLPVAFGAGYLLQRHVLNTTLGRDPLPSLVVTFGLAIVIQNALLEVFSA